MRRLPAKIKPTYGFAHSLHLLLTVVLPVLILVLVRINLAPLAVVLVLLGKWRMLAVRPRYWLANIRANAADIIVSLAVITYMVHTTSGVWQLAWTAAYATWLVLIKPSSSMFGVSVQAFITLVSGLMSIFLIRGGATSLVLAVLVWVVCYSAARHFFTSFDEARSSFLANTWGFFGASVAWLLSYWLLFYGLLPQPVLLLSVLGFGLATLYYLEQGERLSVLLRRQFIFIMLAIIIVVLAFSDWGDKTI